jgi:hypothetical protein
MVFNYNYNGTLNYVEELTDFPFADYSEYKQSVFDRKVVLFIDRSVALESANHVFSFTSSLIRLLSFMPIIVYLLLVFYIVSNRIWMLFLSVPVVFIYSLLLHPNLKSFAPSCIPRILETVNWACLVIGIARHIYWLSAVSAAIVTITCTRMLVYHMAVKQALILTVKNEHFLCDLWNNRLLSIVTNDGIRHFHSISYDDI